ncbi:MAG: hypothetical protein AAFV53_37965 [Myxococcota bacterium]
MQDYNFTSYEAHLEELHVGRYAIADVSRWTGLSAGRVRRWLGTSGSYPPRLRLVKRHESTPINLASFLDVVELHMVSELVKKGMNFKKIRASLHEAAQLNEVSHPLARQKYLLHAGRLFMPSEKSGIYELDAGGQLAITAIIKHRAEDIEFDPKGVAERFWLQGRNKGVYMDPFVTAGIPVVEGTSIMTEVLYEAWRLEDGDTKIVAEQYGIEETQVRYAIEFESGFRKQVA